MKIQKQETVTSQEIITPLQILLADDFKNDGYDDFEYDDYPFDGVLELTREY